MDNTRLSTSSLLVDQPNSLMEEFARAAAFSGLQSPVNGVAQCLEQSGVTGPLLSALQFVDAPVTADFGTARWHAQQLGAAAGMAIPFLALHRGVSFCSGKLAGSFGVGVASKGLMVADFAATGVLYDGVLRPTDSEKRSFFEARLSSAIVGGATMSTLAVGSIALKSLGTHGSGYISALMRNDIIASTLGGIPAGLVHAQGTSLMEKGQFSGVRDSLQSAYSFAALGGFFSLGKATVGNLHENLGARYLENQRRSVSEDTMQQRREALLKERVDLDAKRQELNLRRERLRESDPAYFSDLVALAKEYMENATAKRQNRRATIEALEDSIFVARRSAKRGIVGGVSERSLELALQDAKVLIPRTKGDPFFLRSASTGGSVPLLVKGQIPARLGAEVLSHCLSSIERPTILEFINDSSKTFRGRANSLVDGHVILNFDEYNSRIPVHDHEMGHVVDVRYIETNPDVSNAIQSVYEQEVRDSSHRQLVKDVLLQTDYVYPRKEIAEPVDRAIPDSMRKPAYYSSRREVVAESYKLYLQSKRLVEQGATSVPGFPELIETYVDNPGRRQSLCEFSRTYAVLEQQVFEPLYLAEMAKRARAGRD